MKFEFDSNNATELRAVEAAVAVLLDRLPAAQMPAPLVAAVTQAQEDLMMNGASTEPPVGLVNAEVQARPQSQGESIPSPERAAALRDEAETREKPYLAAVDFSSLPKLDSAGQPWNPELHSSSRAKVADGTWKKRRGQKLDGVMPNSAPPRAEPDNALIDAARGRDPLPEAPTPPSVPAPPTPVTPPAPPVPAAPTPAAAPSAEQKIWALITGEVVTINRVLEVARAHGHADLGALRQADEAAKAEVLKVLEGE